MALEVTLTTDNFRTEVLESEIPVLVDFWAEWCMPCRMVDPIVKELAQELPGKLKVGKVNVDDQADLAQEYGVVSIPTLLFFKKGQVVKQQIGAAPKKALQAIVDAL